MCWYRETFLAMENRLFSRGYFPTALIEYTVVNQLRKIAK